MKAKIMLVDDHAIVLHGLTQLINSEADMEVTYLAESAEAALEQLDQGVKPDLLITDISLPGLSGIELIKTLANKHNDVPVLVISMHDELIHGERSFRAGAKGYIMKQEATDKVIVAIRKIMGGEVYLSDRMQALLLQKMRGSAPAQQVSVLSNLTDREYEVLRMIGLGLGSSEIATKLNRSVKTIEAHRANLKQKLGLKSASELNRFAANWADRERF
jgi:two-component system, NarL family, response regulator NreC